MAIATSELPALDPRHPFSRADARAAGLALSELVGSRYKRILYDSYVPASVPVTWQLRAEAALKASGPGAYASHQTAAILWGGTVPDPADVHITVPSMVHRSRRRGVSAHEGGSRPAPASFRGVALSSPAHTFIDLAAELSLVDLVVLGDSVVKACRVSVAELVAATGHHDIRRREELDRRGLRVIVVTADDIYRHPEQVLLRVRDALIDRGATGIRRTFKPEWRRHFPERATGAHRGSPTATR